MGAASPDGLLPHPDGRLYSGNGIRTRVLALRGLRPSPLDDTARFAGKFGETQYHHLPDRDASQAEYPVLHRPCA